MRWTWLPWKRLIRMAARRHGFLDPLALLARLRHLSQPSEVGEPIELLRAGVVFHARGLVNTRVIQHNLDWIWPYWIERQFDPSADSFLPRAFSITHVNLTHRNWTAVGVPDHDVQPIVDPRGLATPHYDGWSLDAWVRSADGHRLYPSRVSHASQDLRRDGGPVVATRTAERGLALESEARVEHRDGLPELVLRYRASSPNGGELILALRPYNPEGISFVHRIALDGDRSGWTVDGAARVRFDRPVSAHYASDYRLGDVALHLDAPDGLRGERCSAGLATAAALFRLEPGEPGVLEVRVPLETSGPRLPERSWGETRAGAAALELPDARDRELYNAAVDTLLLHSVDDVYPGPFTYRRFWFRDAAYILYALLLAGYPERVESHLARFPDRQTRATGYFHSQEGEWDSNGQALWIMSRFLELTGRELPDDWIASLRRGGRWIARKRTGPGSGAPHAGLLPAGFSAEHFGPNDYYYWDDLWSIAGLRTAGSALQRAGRSELASEFRLEADDLEAAIDRCRTADRQRLGRPGWPASPYRRLDSGAVGVLAASYPLQLVAPNDPDLVGTADHLLRTSRVRSAFFHDMIHSGINAYLTLHLAQALLRAGDVRYRELMDAVAALASPTGQWPEAIHPRTLGGCMGDGQHVWAAADWVAMVRNCFVREEGDRLLIGAGIPPRWLAPGGRLRFGPAPTTFGTVSIDIEPAAGDLGVVRWEADWRRPPAAIEVGRIDGRRRTLDAGARCVDLHEDTACVSS
jgi:hypothetical protein